MFRSVIILSVVAFLCADASKFSKKFKEQFLKKSKLLQVKNKSLRKGKALTADPTWGTLTRYSDDQCTEIESYASIQFGVCIAETTTSLQNLYNADGVSYDETLYDGTACEGTPTGSTNYQVPGDVCTQDDEYWVKSKFGTAATYSTYNFISYSSQDACKKGTASEVVSVDAQTEFPFPLNTCVPDGDVSYKFSASGSSWSINYYKDNTCGTFDETIVYKSCAEDDLNEGTTAYSFPSSSDDESVCFAGSETVSLEDGSIKQISEVIVGDRILAADMDGTTAYSTVVALAHPQNKQVASFVHIETASTDIKVTPEHFLMASVGCVAPMALTKAADVAVNSCLLTLDGASKVTSSTMVVEAGIYSVITEKELIVVNGVIASPFAVNHEIANGYYSIHRTLMAYFPALLKSSLFENLHFAISAFVASI